MRFVPWLAVGLIGIGCSSGLPVGHADAGRDSGGNDCGPPPENGCGYRCESGHWTPSLLLCLPDSGMSGGGQPDLAAAPDVADAGLATADAEPACVPVTSNDAGPVATCPCLRAQACPAGGPSGLACDDEGLDCNYSGKANACGIVNCICTRDVGGLHWECFILLY
jgi:hypothetical protein